MIPLLFFPSQFSGFLIVLGFRITEKRRKQRVTFTYAAEKKEKYFETLRFLIVAIHKHNFDKHEYYKCYKPK